VLADRVDGLRVRSGTDRGRRLGGYLDALAASPNPQSTLRWMQTPPFALVEDVVDGRLSLTHPQFDERQGSGSEKSAIAYLRAALVAHGALPPRDETAASFSRWLSRTLPELPDGPDRATVTAFANWHVARKLAATTARHGGAPPRSATKHARNQIRQAIALARSLHAKNLELADLRQDLLDEWVAEGASTRRVVNSFVDWLSRAQPHKRQLTIAWPTGERNVAIASDQQRLHALTALLENPNVEPGIRFAAAAVLLFGQPLTRVSALRRGDLTQTPTGWQVRFGQRPVALPRRLHELAAELTAAAPSGRARTAAGSTDWLMPGRKHGAHTTAEDLRRRLTVLGLPIRPGRRSALLALAVELPAPVLAEHFAVHRARAAQWTRAAGVDYAPTFTATIVRMLLCPLIGVSCCVWTCPRPRRSAPASLIRGG
jgi:hypothetical protein